MKRPARNHSCATVGLGCDFEPKAWGHILDDAFLRTLLPGGPWYRCRRCGFAVRGDDPLYGRPLVEASEVRGGHGIRRRP